MMRRKGIKPVIFSTLLFVFSLTLFLVTQIYLRQYNIQLNNEIQVAEARIDVLANEQEALRVEVDQLASKAKVMDVAAEAGLESNKNSTVYIKDPDE